MRNAQEVLANFQIPVIGIIPWLNDTFPPEDSLDLLEKKSCFTNPDIKWAL